jgi:DNA-binding NarL/FixJ family response regulator
MVKIALIDDHQMFLDGMKSILSNQNGFEIVFEENSAKKALIQLNSIEPDLIITDISMPEMNGIEFIKIVRNTFPNIKILVVSMFKNLQTYENINGFLLKESDAQEFILAIKTIVHEDKNYFKIENKTEDEFTFNKTILSDREKEIIQLIANELTTDEIAEKLFLSKGTIETHRKNIFIKLQVKNIAGMVKKAIYLGVINS